jgi:hypothetical protein
MPQAHSLGAGVWFVEGQPLTVADLSRVSGFSQSVVGDTIWSMKRRGQAVRILGRRPFSLWAAAINEILDGRAHNRGRPRKHPLRRLAQAARPPSSKARR